MASIDDRWFTKGSDGQLQPTARNKKGLRWQVRYRDENGVARKKSFAKKSDADKYCSQVEYEINVGSYIDPKIGQIRFNEFASKWLSTRTVNRSTVIQNELHLRLHILPTWANFKLNSIKHSDIQSWISHLASKGLSPRTVRLIFADFRMVLEIAVRDGVLVTNPAIPRYFSFPKQPGGRLEVWSRAQCSAIINALSGVPRLIALLGATTGLRQGELFGVRIQDLDLEKNVLVVRQQIKVIDYKPTPDYPKTRRSRTVPLQPFVAALLAAHLEQVVPLEGERTLEPSVGGLIFFLRERKPINKNYFNKNIWHHAIKQAGLPVARNGMHGLRHYFASVLLEEGVNIKAVSQYLGHSDPGFTLKVYMHLMPDRVVQIEQAFKFANQDLNWLS